MPVTDDDLDELDNSSEVATLIFGEAIERFLGYQEKRQLASHITLTALAEAFARTMLGIVSAARPEDSDPSKGFALMLSHVERVGKSAIADRQNKSG
jgi:hypothetical protein